MSKKKICILIIALAILGCLLAFMCIRNKTTDDIDHNTYVTDSDYLYEKVLEDIQSKDAETDKTLNNNDYYQGTKDIKRFYSYEPLGIVLNDNYKEVYIIVAMGKYYLRDEKIYQNTVSNILYLYRFQNEEIINSANEVNSNNIPKKVEAKMETVDKNALTKKVEEQVLEYYKVEDKTINVYDETLYD